MTLRNHLRPHQHIHFAAVNACQLRFERALQLGAVGINAHDAHGLAIGPLHIDQQL